MSRLSKTLALTVAVVFVLACNVVTQPFRDAENLAETAQSFGSALPMETLQALPSAIPVETLQALPSLAPSLEAFATNLPDVGNIMDPQGTPVQEWRDIPVMPDATAGQDFPENDIYSFRIDATTAEIEDFYKEKMTALGWSQPFDATTQGDVGIVFFQKGNNALTVTIMSSEGSTVVILTLV